jgi:hypothetical protein
MATASSSPLPAGALAPAELLPKQDDPLLRAKDMMPAAGWPDMDHRRQHAAAGDGVACCSRVSTALNRRLASGRGLGPARQGEPAPAAGSASLAPAAPQHPPGLVEAHLVWERQLAKLGSLDLRLVGEPGLGAMCDQMDQLEDLILGTPARTLEGAVVRRWCRCRLATRIVTP